MRSYASSYSLGTLCQRVENSVLIIGRRRRSSPQKGIRHPRGRCQGNGRHARSSLCSREGWLFVIEILKDGYKSIL